MCRIFILMLVCQDQEVIEFYFIDLFRSWNDVSMSLEWLGSWTQEMEHFMDPRYTTSSQIFCVCGVVRFLSSEFHGNDRVPQLTGRNFGRSVGPSIPVNIRAFLCAAVLNRWESYDYRRLQKLVHSGQLSRSFGLIRKSCTTDSQLNGKQWSDFFLSK